MGFAFLLPWLVAACGWMACRWSPVAWLSPVAGEGQHAQGTAAQLARLVFLTSLLGGLLVLLLWLLLEPPVIAQRSTQALLASETQVASETQSASSRQERAALDLLRTKAQNLAAGDRPTESLKTEALKDESDSVASVARAALVLRQATEREAWLLPVLVVLGGLLGLLAGSQAPRRGLHPRKLAERIIAVLLLLSAATALAVTVGILLSLIFESWRFFRLVPLSEFLFGLRWEPQIALRADQVAGLGAFGAVPVLLGTAVISLVALLVAAPLGILSAVWLVEYASPRTRSICKPVLEILAGIPTVVYGFFAVVALAPAFREGGAWLGFTLAPNSALVAGFVMGVMILPFISSLTDDALYAVPQSLREGAFALGATSFEVASRVVLPTAAPGIVSAFLLAISRALGETMIVLMAAGLLAKMTINPLDSVTTVTVQIVTLLTGDTEFDNPKTLSAFALGLLLLVITLFLNWLALRVSRRWHKEWSA